MARRAPTACQERFFPAAAASASLKPGIRCGHFGGIVVNLVVTTDDVVAQLQLAITDVAVERQLSPAPTTQQSEAIPAFTDELARTSNPSLPDAIRAGLGTDEQAAFLTAAKDKAHEIWKDFGEWRQRAFPDGADPLKTIAEKVQDAASNLGVSAEHLVARLQRRIMSGLVQNSVLPPFQAAGQGNQPLTFAAKNVVVTSTMRSAPSLASLDLSGVVELLSGILALELDVEVCYSPDAGSGS
jgi:hypothetical protein